MSELTTQNRPERLDNMFKRFNSLTREQKGYFFTCFFGGVENELLETDSVSLDTFELALDKAVNYITKSFSNE